MRLKLRHISTLSRAKNIRPSYNGKAGRAKLGYDNIVLSAGTMANQQLSGLVPAHNDPDMAVRPTAIAEIMPLWFITDAKAISETMVTVVKRRLTIVRASTPSSLRHPRP